MVATLWSLAYILNLAVLVCAIGVFVWSAFHAVAPSNKSDLIVAVTRCAWALAIAAVIVATLAAMARESQKRLSPTLRALCLLGNILAVVGTCVVAYGRASRGEAGTGMWIAIFGSATAGLNVATVISSATRRDG